MEQKEKQALAEAMRASAPKQAQPRIGAEEMDRYPCSVRPVQVEVEGEEPVQVYLTVPFQVVPGAPVFVNYHGGGFIRGRSDRDELFCRRLACTFQCVVVDVDYALAPDYPFPTAVHQARAAALWAKAQAPDLDCDPRKGDPAGPERRRQPGGQRLHGRSGRSRRASPGGGDHLRAPGHEN